MLIEAKPDTKFGIIRAMTSRDNNLLNIRWLCDIAGVSRSGYYHWLSAEKTRDSRCTNHQQIAAVIDEWIDYYNNERGQWDLARLSPNEYYSYLLSGVYPLPVTPPKGAELTSRTDANLVSKDHSKCP